MKNEQVYETVQTIVDSQEMNMNTLDSLQDAVTTVNHLRVHIKTLIDVVYVSRSETNEVKKIAEMLQKLERAKARFVERAIDNTLREDHKDIMSYDARRKDAVVVAPVRGKIDINA
tara:strand:- start:1485 stop:1832 length:348 start_codon:yes stop_codon:yes gene_type:complete